MSCRWKKLLRKCTWEGQINNHEEQNSRHVSSPLKIHLAATLPSCAALLCIFSLGSKPGMYVPPITLCWAASIINSPYMFITYRRRKEKTKKEGRKRCPARVISMWRCCCARNLVIEPILMGQRGQIIQCQRVFFEDHPEGGSRIPKRRRDSTLDQLRDDISPARE